jgi:hypothetical protein
MAFLVLALPGYVLVHVTITHKTVVLFPGLFLTFHDFGLSDAKMHGPLVLGIPESPYPNFLKCYFSWAFTFRNFKTSSVEMPERLVLRIPETLNPDMPKWISYRDFPEILDCCHVSPQDGRSSSFS